MDVKDQFAVRICIDHHCGLVLQATKAQVDWTDDEAEDSGDRSARCTFFDLCYRLSAPRFAVGRHYISVEELQSMGMSAWFRIVDYCKICTKLACISLIRCRFSLLNNFVGEIVQLFLPESLVKELCYFLVYTLAFSPWVYTYVFSLHQANVSLNIVIGSHLLSAIFLPSRQGNNC